MKKKDIQEFVTLLTEEADAKGETKKLAEVIEKKLQEFIDVFTEFEMDLPEALHRILDSKKLNLPKTFDVKVTNPRDMSPVFNSPKEIEIKRSKWMDELKDTMDAVKDGLDVLKKKEMTLPKKAKDAIAVRLSDGEEFYKAITEVYQTAMAPGGGGNVPKIVVSGGVQAVPIVNPDGSNIGGSGGTSATDDADFTAGSTTGTPAMGVYESTPTSVTDGDMGVVGITANRELKVSITSGSTSGTQYTEGDTDASITGTALMFESNTGTNAVSVVSNSAPLPISDASGSITVDGTVTASAQPGVDIGDVTINNASGASAVNIQDGGNSITVDGTFWQTTQPVSLASVPSHAVTNAGTFAVQVDGSALTSLQLIDDTIFSDDAAFTPGTSKVSVVGFQADETSTDSIDEGDAGAPRMTLDRKVIVTPQPHTTGGCSIFRSLDLDESEEEVKATAGQVYGLMFTNTATSTRWLKFYNATAANVTVGTTTPVITIGLPGNTSDDISGVFSNGGLGITFDTAICVAATTGVADNDTGAPAANDVIVNVFYK